jgi:hypothetical protein
MQIFLFCASPELQGRLSDSDQAQLGMLTTLAKIRLRRIQHRSSLIDGFLAKTDLDLTPFVHLH